MLVVAVALAASVAACGGSRGVEVVDARVALPPANDQASVYLTIRNTGDENDQLVSVATDDAADAHVHETSIDAEGRASMRSVSSIDVPAGESVVLEPGHYHLMLMRPKPLQPGDTVTLKLRFRYVGVVTVRATATDDLDAVLGK